MFLLFFSEFIKIFIYHVCPLISFLMSSSSALAASVLRSPPYDKSSTNAPTALRVSFISVGALHKERFGSIGFARRKSVSFFEEAIRR
jgi:hypothetical protein